MLVAFASGDPVGRTLSRSIGILVLTVGTVATQNRLAIAQRGAPGGYAITEIGTLGGETSEAFGLNNLGDVVGAAATRAGDQHAFLYRTGQILDLGTLTGGSSSRANAINDRGDVIGYSAINAFGPPFRELIQGFVWQNGAMRAVGALYCPCSFNVRYGTSMAFAVSDDGVVVGDSETSRETFRGAFVWQDGTIHGFSFDGATPGNSHAYGINDIHEIVGDANDRAFLVRDRDRQDLGVLPGYLSSSARAVNNKGQVVGVSTNSAATRAFLWDLGRMRDLGTLAADASSEARAINVMSDVVGRSGSTDFSESRAVLWHDGVAIDLSGLVSESGWTLSNATAINDLGQIVGAGVHDGRVRAFLLTPR